MTGRRTLSRRILIALNIAVIIPYLITCLLPFVNTGENWILALPGLVFPFILFALLFFIVLMAFLRSKWWWISLIVLGLGFQQILSVFAFNFSKEFSYDKKPNTLRVLQWNVTDWDEGNKSEFGESTFRLSMLDLVNKQEADVLCFQEFFESTDTAHYKPNIVAVTKMGFPYYYFVATKGYPEAYKSGIAIFSRYPIIDSAKYDFKGNYTGEHLLYTDIKVNDKKFRIFATHLQPVYLNQRQYKISNLLEGEEEDNTNDDGLLSKLKRGYEFRYSQAEFVRKKINESPFPVIICGDFNDLPNSSVYFTIKGKLQDTFLKKGSGFGRTTPFISPTLRIDYIFADKYFKVNQFQVLRVPYSGNHYPIVTDLAF